MRSLPEDWYNSFICKYYKYFLPGLGLFVLALFGIMIVMTIVSYFVILRILVVLVFLLGMGVMVVAFGYYAALETGALIRDRWSSYVEQDQLEGIKANFRGKRVHIELALKALQSERSKLRYLRFVDTESLLYREELADVSDTWSGGVRPRCGSCLGHILGIS